MELDFQLTEDKKALDQLELAKNGMSWYSGGVNGLMEPLFDMISAILTLIGVSVIILTKAPIVLIIVTVVVLDEPTAALDPLAEYEIYKQFEELVSGKTAIYISHRLSSCQFCDRIAVFDGGCVREYGTHAELVGKEGGIYAKMFAAQAQYYVS